VSASTPSHRLKLYRSDKHLEEMQALLTPLAGRREYPVVESVQRQHKRRLWDYRLDLSGITPPEEFPIILGDYLFDIRSALDHLIVAIAPRKYRHKVGFPICTEDPLLRDKTSGSYLNVEEARKWQSMTKGLPSDCVAALKTLQPYHAAREHRKPASIHALALLSALQNADKHRELIGILVGLHKVEATFNGVPEGIVPALEHNAIVARAEAQMDVEVEGSALVGVKWSNKGFGLADLVDRLGHFIAEEALPRLEPFLD
jgi:hypothetical protein